MRLALASAFVGLAAFAGAQEFRVGPIRRDEQASLERLLNRVVQGQRTADRWARWDFHFLKGAEGRTYVPFTLTLADAGEGFASAAVYVRIATREIMNARFGAFGYRVVLQNAYAVDMRPAPSGGRFTRSALMLRPGQYEVFIAVQERVDDEGARSAVVTHSLTVPDFTKKGLLLSSVMVVDRLEPLGDRDAATAGAARPYVLGASEAVPAADTEFNRDETLTVAFQVYNAAMFVDGKPDLQVDYRVSRAGDNRPIGATAPQTFDVDTLPEEFNAAAGHQLTPVQALPLKQFEPGVYRLHIEVRDFLGDGRAQAEIAFTIVP